MPPAHPDPLCSWSEGMESEADPESEEEDVDEEADEVEDDVEVEEGMDESDEEDDTAARMEDCGEAPEHPPAGYGDATPHAPPAIRRLHTYALSVVAVVAQLPLSSSAALATTPSFSTRLASFRSVHR